MLDVNRFSAIQIALASPDKIRTWSKGEVKKPETINYRSQKPERDGLFCEKIFGPVKDYECSCGKYKKIRHSGITCNVCGVEVTTKSVRRERMGHIELASPVAHFWYIKGNTPRIGRLLDINPVKNLAEVIYFVSHIVLKPGKTALLQAREVLNEKTARARFIAICKEILSDVEPESEDAARANTLIERMENPNETFDFYTFSNFITKHTGAEFGIGAEAIKVLLAELDLDEELRKIQEELKLVQSKSQGKMSQKREKLLKRLEIVDSFLNSPNKPEWMVLDVLPVIPPDLRPMLQLDGGRFAASDLNDLYRRVITRNNRLKKLLEIKAPFVILMNEKRMLQEAVDALIDNGRLEKPVLSITGRQLKSLSHTLEGKQGRFRQNLLGKRVDYSGRSVIAVGPNLKMDECGIPREMAIQLFKPYIAAEMMKRGYVQGHKLAEKAIEQGDQRVLDIIEEVVKDRHVLLNRAPTLHRLGIQAFKPVLVDGRAIRLHPLVTPAFNADFDGDQMAVHVPLFKNARDEAASLMLGSHNILGPKDGKPIVNPSQDMVLGNYYLTMESSKQHFLDEAAKRELDGDIDGKERYELFAATEGKVFASADEVILAYETKQVHLQTRIAIPVASLNNPFFTEEQNKMLLITTPGKIIFNRSFPKGFVFLNGHVLNSEGRKTGINFETVHPQFLVARGTNVREYIASLPLSLPFGKKDVEGIIAVVFNRFKTEATAKMLDQMKDTGFRYATIAGITVSIADITLVEGKEELIAAGDAEVAKLDAPYRKGLITEGERHKKVVKVWEDIGKKIKDKYEDQIKREARNPIIMMADSGARGSVTNFVQLKGMRGLMKDPSGETIELPIKSSFREGLTVSEFFISTHGARKGGADTALKTADSGYLTRKLVDVAQDVVVREDDCGTDFGFVVRNFYDASVQLDDDGKPTDKTVKPLVELKDRLFGRYLVNDFIDSKTGEVLVSNGKMMDDIDAKKIAATGVLEVEVRSLFGCQTRSGVCAKCYGRNLASGERVRLGDAVGIMAAQSIGEPGTQLTMRTFHSGGVAGSSDITEGLPRVQELFEARNPKGEAIISDIAGTVVSIETEKDSGGSKVTVKNEREEKTYTTYFGNLLKVQEGHLIKAGQQITAGAIDPKKLLKAAGMVAVQNYILREVHKVYSASGIGISDKHIEVIIRQMLRKVQVVDSGDTNILPGTEKSSNIDVFEFTDINTQVLTNGKNPAVARPLLHGISKSSIFTESFLSAASFQETSNVLTIAATKGLIDSLHGLKENVIIGKLIPAGKGSEFYANEAAKEAQLDVEVEDLPVDKSQEI